MTEDKFSWVIKVLESCENIQHIKTCDNLFEFFLKLDNTKLNEKGKLYLESVYQKIKKKKISQIQGNFVK